MCLKGFVLTSAKYILVKLFQDTVVGNAGEI